MAKMQEETGVGQKESQKETQKESRLQEPRGKQTELARQPAQLRSSDPGMVPARRGIPLARHSARGPLAQLRDEFDRLFDRFFSRGGLGMPAARWDDEWGLDVREDDESVMIRAEAPGFEPSDFDIQVRSGQLVMSASHRAKEDEGGEYRGWRHEFYEAVTLPAEVAADKVKAAYRHGILTVTLPKSEDGKARRIKVEG